MAKKKSIKQQQVERLLRESLTLDAFENALVELGIKVVRPGTILPAVYHMGEVRWFPDLNEDDRVVGGSFG